MKTGLFGGTFNPFHKGHIRIIEHVRDSLGFDRIFIIPSATPPHKPNLNLAPAQLRYHMVSESLKDRQGLIASDKEIIRGGSSFTIDTIRSFKESFSNNADIFFIMGSDAFLDINTWSRKDRIFFEVKIVIMLRPLSQDIGSLISFVKESISEGYQYKDSDQKKSGQSFIHQTRQPIYICKVPEIDISSTMIRERISHGKSVRDLVPPNVLSTIQANRLYKGIV